MIVLGNLPGRQPLPHRHDRDCASPRSVLCPRDLCLQTTAALQYDLRRSAVRTQRAVKSQGVSRYDRGHASMRSGCRAGMPRSIIERNGARKIVSYQYRGAVNCVGRRTGHQIQRSDTQQRHGGDESRMLKGRRHSSTCSKSGLIVPSRTYSEQYDVQASQQSELHRIEYSNVRYSAK
jgi:hypothetical protein